MRRGVVALDAVKVVVVLAGLAALSGCAAPNIARLSAVQQLVSGALVVPGVITLPPPAPNGKRSSGLLLKADEGALRVLTYRADALGSRLERRRVAVTGARYEPEGRRAWGEEKYTLPHAKTHSGIGSARPSQRTRLIPTRA